MRTLRRLYAAAFLAAAAITCAQSAYAQAIPQRISYQGIARNQSGAPLINSPVGVRISILDGSALGNAVYIETHQVVTNEFGLFTLQVGGGSPFAGTMGGINWGASFKWMRVEVDLSNEGQYSLLGTSQLLSVPYALSAGKPTDMSLNDLSDVNAPQPTVGQGLRWNGTAWVPGSSTAVVEVRPRLTGNGTAGDPLDIARQGAAFGQVLKWNGTTWEPGDDEGDNLTAGPGIDIINNELRHAAHTGDVSGTVNLTVKGLLGRPLLNVPPVTGQVLKYSDAEGGWVPSTDNSQVLYAGNGIDITNGIISSTLWTATGANIYRASGSVGIGTSTPLEQFHVTNNFYLGKAFMPNGNAGNVGQLLTSDGTNKAPIWKSVTEVFGTSGWSLTGNPNLNPGIHFLGTTDNNPLIIKTGGTERMRILGSGEIGIGDSTPGAKLEVGGGDIYVNNSANGVILKSSNGNCWRITVDNNGGLTTTQVTCP